MCWGYTPDEFARALRLIAEGQVDAASLVTATVGIDGVATAFADLANPERHTKIIVEPWREMSLSDSDRPPVLAHHRFVDDQDSVPGLSLVQHCRRLHYH